VVIYNLILEYHNKGQDKRSYSALALNSQTPQTPTCPHYTQVIHSPGLAGARRAADKLPKLPKLHKQMSMITGFKRPGTQVKDFGGWNLGIKKGRLNRPLLRLIERGNF